jgi:hypothetical protein
MNNVNVFRVQLNYYRAIRQKAQHIMQEMGNQPRLYRYKLTCMHVLQFIL